MPKNNRSTTTTEAHFCALEYIMTDAAMGLIPCHDYLIRFYEVQGLELPEPAPELVHHLTHSKRLLHDSNEFKRIQNVFAKYGVRTPIGLEDLPLHWGLAFEKLLYEINWVEAVPHESRMVCEWDFLQQFGCYLNIQFPRCFEPRDSNWPTIGNYLFFLHQILEPGPFTAKARLCEFF